MKRTLPCQPSEAQVQKAILAILQYDRNVVFASRTNSGLVVTKDTVIRLLPKGTSDIIGMLQGGYLLAVEVKRPKPHYRKPTSDQLKFLEMVSDNGGCAFVATSPEDTITRIKEWITIKEKADEQRQS